MKHTICAAVAVLCAALALFGCAAAPSASQSGTAASAGAASSQEAAPELPPAYTGPLYEISIEALPEPFGELTEPQAAEGVLFLGGLAASDNHYYFAPDGTALNLQRGEPWVLEGISEDFYLFRPPYGADPSETDNCYITDHHGSVLTVLPSGVSLQQGDSDRAFSWYAREGYAAYYDSETNEHGILDIAAGSFTLIDHDYIFKRRDPPGELPLPLPITSIKGNFCFSEGLIPVQFRDRSNCYCVPSYMGGNFYAGATYSAYVCECDFAGFMDYSGEMAFCFRDNPDLADCLVFNVSGFVDGTCIIQTRPLDRAQLPGEFHWLRQWGSHSTFYKIDRTGAIVGESTQEEFKAYGNVIRDGEIDLHSIFSSREGRFDHKSTRVKSVVIKPGLAARADQNGVFLEDANGTIYPIELPEGCGAVNLFAQDENVWILLSENPLDAYRAELGNDIYTHIVRVKSIMPEGYTVPEDFCSGRTLLDYECADPTEAAPLPKEGEEGSSDTAQSGTFIVISEEEFQRIAQAQREREIKEATALKEAEEAAGGILRLRIIQ